MKIIADSHIAEQKPYVPPPLGNGDIALQVDFEGGMRQESYSSQNMTPGIRKAGVRYDSPGFPLVPFGFITVRAQEQPLPAHWTQSIDTDSGLVESVCYYPDGNKVESETFCHLTRDIICFRKKFSRPQSFRLDWHFTPRRTVMAGIPTTGLLCRIDGLEQYEEEIFLWSDRDTTCEYDREQQSWKYTGTGEEVTFFFCFGREDAEYARQNGFEKLLAESSVEWCRYHSESTVEIPEKNIAATYAFAQYQLRTIATKWSVPVGLYSSHWEGRYFGFDEHFVMEGLLSSGHFSIAARIPEFRKNHLCAAQERTSRYFGQNDGSARYAWEAVEYPGLEGSPQGFWLDHNFNMANIALSCLDYWHFTGDAEYLRDTGYPVIRGCAEFYRLQAVYRDSDGSLYLGKCTDLERLGAARERTFMSTCGAIAALEGAAKAAQVLDCDHKMIAEWNRIAGELRRSLPSDRVKYVPYPGCRERSIAVLSGIYPYRILDESDPLLRNAIQDYLANGGASGNMYPVGNGICTWYAAWLAIALIRIGGVEEALNILRKTADDTGCFYDIFEICESRSNPYFSSAEGCFIQAVNEIFVQNGHVRDGAMPTGWKATRFRLPGHAGKWLQDG